MPNDLKFLDALQLDAKSGTLTVKGSAEMDALLEGMREVGKTNDPQLHRAMGAAIREPIRLLARYRAWTQNFFDPYPVNMGEENPVLIDSPIGAAFISSPEGRVEYVAPGVQRVTYPKFTRIKAGVMIRWDDLAVARWNILQRRLEEAADAMAARRDAIGKAVLDAAITAASHNTPLTTTMDKTNFDAMLIAAAQTGFPITQCVINPARAMDMSKWTNGTTSALPTYFAPQSAAESMYRQLWFQGYGNIRYFLSYNVPMTKVYFAGEPSQIGYEQSHGGARSVSDMDIDNMADKHSIWEDVAYYVGNQYNLWSFTIS